MHELTLAERALHIVTAAAEQAEASRVTRIRLSIGALAHVDADALQYSCEIVSRGTLADGARFEVERLPGQAHCGNCRAQISLCHIGDACPVCGGFDLTISDGDQLRIIDISVT